MNVDCDTLRPFEEVLLFSLLNIRRSSFEPIRRTSDMGFEVESVEIKINEAFQIYIFHVLACVVWASCGWL